MLRCELRRDAARAGCGDDVVTVRFDAAGRDGDAVEGPAAWAEIRARVTDEVVLIMPC